MRGPGTRAGARAGALYLWDPLMPVFADPRGALGGELPAGWAYGPLFSALADFPFSRSDRPGEVPPEASEHLVAPGIADPQMHQEAVAKTRVALLRPPRNLPPPIALESEERAAGGFTARFGEAAARLRSGAAAGKD